MKNPDTMNGLHAIPNPEENRGPSEQVGALLFDMDNTLFDFVGVQMAACKKVARSLGITEDDLLYPYFLRRVHGYESPENILDFLLDYGIPVSGAYESARRVYEQEKIRSIIPYPGVFETLSLIRDWGIPMAIITDAHSRDALRRLEKAGLLPFFSCMVTYDLVRVKKPAHEPFIAILEMLKSTADRVLFVGDSPRRDIEPAKTLGFRTVYARYGDRFSDTRVPVQADYTLDSMAELPEILSRFLV